MPENPKREFIGLIFLLVLVLIIFVLLPHQRVVVYILLPSFLLIGLDKFIGIPLKNVLISPSEREAYAKRLANFSNASFIVGVVFAVGGWGITYLAHVSRAMGICVFGACSSISIGIALRTYRNLVRDRWC